MGLKKEKKGKIDHYCIYRASGMGVPTVPHRLHVRHRQLKPGFHMIAHDRRIAGITEA